AQGVQRPPCRASMTDYGEADFSRLKTVPIAQRPNKVDPTLLAQPPGTDRSFATFWDSLPDVLGAKDAREVARAVARATGRRGVVVMVGGHVSTAGVRPLRGSTLSRGGVSTLVLNRT